MAHNVEEVQIFVDSSELLDNLSLIVVEQFHVINIVRVLFQEVLDVIGSGDKLFRV